MHPEILCGSKLLSLCFSLTVTDDWNICYWTCNELVMMILRDACIQHQLSMVVRKLRLRTVGDHMFTIAAPRDCECDMCDISLKSLGIMEKIVEGIFLKSHLTALCAVL